MPAQPMDEGQGQQHHPGLADDLPRQKIQTAESKQQENHAIHHQAHRATRGHCQDQTALLQWRIDSKVSGFTQQESRRRGQHQGRRRQGRRKHHTKRDGDEGPIQAKPALHQIPQHQRKADHQHTGWRHEARRHRDQAGAIWHAEATEIPDHPIGGGNTECEADQKGEALNAGRDIHGVSAAA